MGHYVYKYVLDNEIIYIGKNDTNLCGRLSAHGKAGDNIPKEGWDDINKSTIYYVELANSIMSDVFESEMIRRYKPKYNKAKMSDWDGLPFEEPEWKLYEWQPEILAEDNDIPKYLQPPYSNLKQKTIEKKMCETWDTYVILDMLEKKEYTSDGDKIIINLTKSFPSISGKCSLPPLDAPSIVLGFECEHNWYKIFEVSEDGPYVLLETNVDTVNSCASLIPVAKSELIEKLYAYDTFLKKHYPNFLSQERSEFIAKYEHFSDLKKIVDNPPECINTAPAES